MKQQIKAMFATLAIVCAAAGPAAAKTADECDALSDGIDRGRLVYYIEDGVRADRIAAEWYDLEGRIGRAAEWLKLAPYRDGDTAEAIVNARKTAALARTEIARIRTELKALPETGPSFPPVFFWPEGWLQLTFSVMDSLAIKADYLDAEADALAEGDMEEVARITQTRNADLSGFDKSFAAFDREMVALLPPDHPEHLIMAMRVHWHGLFDLYSVREARTDPEAFREASVRIVEKLKSVADEIEADIPRYEATLAGFGERVLPYLVALSCDREAARAALVRYMATYAAFAPLARETVGLLRDYARIEIDFITNGPSPELYDRYDAVAFRYEGVLKKASEQWSQRAKILAGLLPRKKDRK